MPTTAELGIDVPALYETSKAGVPVIVLGLISNKQVPFPWPMLRGVRIPAPAMVKWVTFNVGDQGESRSAAIRFAKEEQADWLFMFDDDTFPSPEALFQLQAVARAHPGPCVVAANYHRRGLRWPTSTSTVRDATGELAPLLADGTVKPVELMGFGCSVFPKKTLDVAPDDWFVDARADNGVAEDWHGSLVAHALGIDLLVDTRLHCAHIDPGTQEVY